MDSIKNIQAIVSPVDYPTPSVAFKNIYDNDSTSGTSNSMSSYLLACSSVYDMKTDDFDDPPISTTVPMQAWENSIHTTTTSA